MLSALIPSAGRQPAVPLAGQLAHESCVRPGPLVLGTAFLRFPTAAPDRDRHFCYRWADFLPMGQVISAWLCMSPCRSDHIFTARKAVFGIWSLRILNAIGIEPFLLIVRADQIVTTHSNNRE